MEIYSIVLLSPNCKRGQSFLQIEETLKASECRNRKVGLIENLFIKKDKI